MVEAKKSIMNKFKKRRDISTMVNMVGKLKNPADETMANLKSIEDMLAGNESGYVIPPISSNISAVEDDELKDVKKKDQSLTEDQKKTLEGAIESGDKKAIRKSGAAGKYKRAAKQDLKAKQKQEIDKASETIKFIGEVNRLNPEA
jgi:hypothetical protein